MQHQSLFSTALHTLNFISYFILWTLVEYLFHRFILHRSNFTKFIHDNKHHANVKFKPSEIPFFILSICLVTLSIINSSFGLLGFSIGMFTYVLLHHISHKKRNFPYLKNHHKYHHLVSPKYNFGISTNLWDIVFGTHKKNSYFYNTKKENVYYE